MFRSAFGSTTTVVYHDADSEMTVAGNDEKPTVESLLVALDSCSRQNLLNVQSTIGELVNLVDTEVEKDPDLDVNQKKKKVEDVVRMVLLIAFKRRNHLKAQADGEGAGEKRFFLEVILSILKLKRFDHLVKNVLHLIPLYGCWKDLRLLGEEILLSLSFDMRMAQSINHAVVRTSAASGSAPQPLTPPMLEEVNDAVRTHPVYQEICRIYADQLLSDARSTENPPSNAAKYAPHEDRHRGHAEKDEDGSVPMAVADDVETPSSYSVPADDSSRKRRAAPRGTIRHVRGRGGGLWRGGAGRGGGRGFGRGGFGRGGRGFPVRVAAVTITKYTREAMHQASKKMAKDIASLTNPEESTKNRGAAAYRKLRAGLNKRLTDQGFLIEPLLCASQYSDIDFIKASKGALMKYKSTIIRHGQQNRWKRAMLTSDKAVPDLDSLVKGVKEYLAEEDELTRAEHSEDGQEEDEEPFRLFPLRIKKAIKSISIATAQLLKSAKEKLVAAGKSPDSLSKTPLLVAIDTAGVDVVADRASIGCLPLLLAGYLLARSLNLQYLMVNGSVMSLETITNEGWMSLAFVNAAERAGTPLHRFREGMNSLLRRYAQDVTLSDQEAPAASSDGNETAPSVEATRVDVAFLCNSFEAYNRNIDDVHQWIEDAHTDKHQNGVCLRTLRVQRIDMNDIASFGDNSVETSTKVEYTPRPELQAQLPSNPAEITADVLFIVDFTASMTSYMRAVKQNLIEVITGIQQAAGVKKIRVGLVGYRDYRDSERVVTVDFHEQNALGTLLQMIENQDASGGGDAPEDMLSGFVAAASLSWQSHIRLQVIISDANAHGYEKSLYGFGGDDFPSGRCPDQEGPHYPSLPQAVAFLANNLSVDTIFCKLNNKTMETTGQAIYEQYPNGKGFGTLSMLSGASSFRDKIMQCITNVVLSTITKSHVEGLQTYDGSTVSTLTNLVKSSVRETLLELGETLLPESDTKESNEKVDEHEDPAAAKRRKAQSDWQRLQRELQLEQMNPVRMSLGMPVLAATKLANAVQLALYKAGVTVEALTENNYPEEIVFAYQNFILSLLSKA